MNEILQFRGLLWLVIAFAPLILLQRLLHRSIQIIYFILTRRADLAMVLFSLTFFPGVLLHESSHFLAARLLGVRTGRFSILPRPIANGRLQLGYVEMEAADPLRETLIGAAPLLSGMIFVAFAGLNRLNMLQAWSQVQVGGTAAGIPAITSLVSQPDFWLWFYLIFTVSSTMLPSASDRRAWQPMLLVGGGLLGLSLLAGAGPWLLDNLAPWLDRLFGAAALVFFISDFAHLLFLVPVILIQKLLQFLLTPGLARDRK